MEIIPNIVYVNILNLWGGRNCPKESQMKQQNVQRQIKPLYEKVNNICNMC